MTDRPSDRLVWFGVLGGPLAWAAQFVANLAVGFAECDIPGRWHLPVHLVGVMLSIAAVGIGLAALAVSAQLFRRTDAIDGLREQVVRGFGGEPPAARIHFLAIVGLTVDGLALAIIVMTGIGAPILTLCQQS